MDKALDKISIYKMRLFNAAIRCGSVKAASDEFEIPYTTFMSEIRRLEKALETPLIIKDRRKTVLTADGEQFAKFSQEILDRFNEQKFVDLSSNKNEITIASTYGVCEIYLTNIIRALCERMPLLKINLLAGREFMDFTTHNCDIVIGPKLSNRPDLSQKIVTTFNYFLFASDKYLEAHGRPKNIDDLKNHKLVIFNQELSSYDEKMPLKGVFVESTSYKCLFNIAKHGSAIIPLTLDQVKEYSSDHSNLINLFPDYICETEQIHFIFRRHSDKVLIIDKFYEMVQDLFNHKRIERVT